VLVHAVLAAKLQHGLRARLPVFVSLFKLVPLLLDAWPFKMVVVNLKSTTSCAENKPAVRQA
jgi:hypothetical protein